MKTQLGRRIGRLSGRARCLAAGLFVLAWGCEASNGPAGPSSQDPVPEVPGILEVSISTSGTRPDADGYAVTVSGEEGDPSLQAVGPMGGTVRFPDLPSGTHSVRLESLAPNCSVQGSNPREFSMASGGTAQVVFTVVCPGPGAVLVKTITTGSDLGDDGYVLAFWADSIRQEVLIGASDSLWISEEDLPSGTTFMTLEGIPANCWSPSGRWRPLAIHGDVTTRVDFSVECMPRVIYNSGITYDRVSPNSNGLSERYILLSNGRFRLQFVGGPSGPFEYLGAYLDSGSTISFVFDDSSGRWVATATIRGNCLVVEYNDNMWLSDFEHGEYCRS